MLRLTCVMQCARPGSKNIKIQHFCSFLIWFKGGNIFFSLAFSLCFANTLIIIVKFSPLGKRAYLLLYFFVFPSTHVKRSPPPTTLCRVCCRNDVTSKHMNQTLVSHGDQQGLAENVSARTSLLVKIPLIGRARV